MKIYCIEDSEGIYFLRFALCREVEAWSVVQFLFWYLSYCLKYCSIFIKLYLLNRLCHLTFCNFAISNLILFLILIR